MSRLSQLTPAQITELAKRLDVAVASDPNVTVENILVKYPQFGKTIRVSARKTSPRRKSTSPRRKTTSPRRKSTSPRRKTTSPRRKTSPRIKKTIEKIEVVTPTKTIEATVIPATTAVATAEVVATKGKRTRTRKVNATVDVVVSPRPALTDRLALVKTSPVVYNKNTKKEVVETYRKSVQDYVNELQVDLEKGTASYGPTYLLDVAADLGFSVNAYNNYVETNKCNLNDDQVKKDNERVALARCNQTAVLDIIEKRNQCDQAIIDDLFALAKKTGKVTDADKAKILGLSNEQMRTAIRDLGITPDCTCRRVDLVSAYLYAKGYLNPLVEL